LVRWVGLLLGVAVLSGCAAHRDLGDPQANPRAAAVAPATLSTDTSLPARYAVRWSSRKRTSPYQLAEKAPTAPQAVHVATFYFANDSAAISPLDHRILQEIVELHRQRGGSVRVVGHASTTGAISDPERRRLMNRAVSERRAASIAKQLRSLGLPQAAIEIEARGDTQPLYDERAPKTAGGNRRVEVFFEETTDVAAVRAQPQAADNHSERDVCGDCGTHAATIYFPESSAELGSREHRIIAELVRIRAAHGGHLTVVAPADLADQQRAAATAYRQRLAVWRANNVAEELRKWGLPAKQLSIARAPVPAVFSGSDADRRVDIYISGVISVRMANGPALFR
jgi:outer membrane protein OmpA-like peptidoglycan-associated protein